MNDEELKLLYGLLARLGTDIDQASYYLKDNKDSEQGKHFVNDAKYTFWSLKDLLNKSKLK